MTVQSDMFGGEHAAGDVTGVKWEQRCPYCLVRHGRPRSLYCCPEHAHRAGLERQRGRDKVRRFYAKVQARVIERGHRESHWRAIRRGADPEPHLQALFGTTPSTLTVVPEWDGDPTR